MNIIDSLVVIILLGITFTLVWFFKSDNDSIFSFVALGFSAISLYFSTLREYLFRPKFIVQEETTSSPEHEIIDNKSWWYRLNISISNDSVVKECAGKLLFMLDQNFEKINIDSLKFGQKIGQLTKRMRNF